MGKLGCWSVGCKEELNLYKGKTKTCFILRCLGCFLNFFYWWFLGLTFRRSLAAFPVLFFEKHLLYRWSRDLCMHTSGLVVCPHPLTTSMEAQLASSTTYFHTCRIQIICDAENKSKNPRKCPCNLFPGNHMYHPWLLLSNALWMPCVHIWLFPAEHSYLGFWLF